MPSGGKRTGAGRPKGTTGIPKIGTINKEMAREALRQIVLANMQQLVAAQMSHAVGLNYLVARHKGSGKFVRLTKELADKILSGEDDQHASIEVWQKDPSVQAFTDLLNRALDKPKEQEQEVRITGDAELIAKLVGARKRTDG